MDTEEVNEGVRVIKVIKKVMHVFKQKMGGCFKEMNLTGTQGMLIGTLTHHGKMKVSDLSETLGLSNSTVSGILDRLENQSLVERIRSKEDRRVVYVDVTTKCRKTFKDQHAEINTMFQNMINKATPEELNVIFKGLDTLEKVIEREEE
ncbi:MarR family winged helix-turn-helix transcriptional regulator [Candidatus Clostridium radicumherbarum]|uniref:MarR family winged helix-turn-helix transcriptional regulator n=1 Tax=Candidatus Clostridium radicumherbarum TaxID=3381662 RepID=A0ABW8TYS1_9CLOT